MKKLGEILLEERISQKLTLTRAAKILLIKKEMLEALEKGNWTGLPEAAFVQGFIKNYAQLLGLDANRLLALYRAEYDERKFPQKHSLTTRRKLMFTPDKLPVITFALAVIIFAFYFGLQYTQVLSAPKLEIYTPPDDLTTTASVIEVAGQTQVDVTVSIQGQLVPIDSSGNFYYQIRLEEGQNIIEVIASRRLSPKTRITRTIRLSR